MIPSRMLRSIALVSALAIVACGGRIATDGPHASSADAAADPDAAINAEVTGHCCVVDGSAYCEPVYSIEMPHPISTTLPCDVGQACRAYAEAAPQAWIEVGDLGVCEP